MSSSTPNGELFSDPEPSVASRPGPEAPLAERMRPRTWDEILGQGILEAGAPLRRALEAGQPPSMILWGPPGSGKTSLARLVARGGGRDFVAFSAVLAGVSEVRKVTSAARRRRAEGGETVLFVDEIHRFNKAQQDAFLPHVEDGTITLIGATTENPSFSLNAALLSRLQVYILKPLAEENLVRLGREALADRERGLGRAGISLSKQGFCYLARTSHGDARSLLNRLETLVQGAWSISQEPRTLSLEETVRLSGQKAVFHDRAGEAHYNLISAFHKAVRGSAPQAALYYLARMLAGGEEPLFICRRMVRMASEDIGLADPQALQVALNATQAFRFLGSPEGELSLAACALYLSLAKKSNRVYKAFGAVQKEVREGAQPEVPLHLRNAPTALMKAAGHGRGYLYPPDHPGSLVRQEYLPEGLVGKIWYQPSEQGFEAEVQKRLEAWARQLEERS